MAMFNVQLCSFSAQITKTKKEVFILLTPLLLLRDYDLIRLIELGALEMSKS